jgi:outer membrane protein OmpA-like peptidoglycan-associated protein
MPAQTAILPAMTAMPQTTVISGAGTSGGGMLYQPYQSQPYQQPTALPASYAGNAVTVDMGAVDRGGGAPSFYPTAMSQAYVPPPTPATLAQPAPMPMPNSPGAAGGPAGIIYFAEGGAALDARDREVLKSVAAIYRQRGGIVRIVGHSSQDGATSLAAQQANLEVSWARANAVARQLAKDGVDPGAIQADAVGANQPLYLETSGAGGAANRRVEIYFY